VQRLQRKHEGLERDLAAIGEKVKDLDDTAQRLMMTHPDQEQSIYEHQREINDLWTGLAHKAEARKTKLLDSYDLQRFLSDFRLVSVMAIKAITAFKRKCCFSVLPMVVWYCHAVIV